jgi:hypothetical protein
MKLESFGAQLFDQACGFRRVSPRDTDLVATNRKAAGHRRADRVSGADQQCHLI